MCHIIRPEIISRRAYRPAKHSSGLGLFKQTRSATCGTRSAQGKACKSPPTEATHRAGGRGRVAVTLALDARAGGCAAGWCSWPRSIDCDAPVHGARLGARPVATCQVSRRQAGEVPAGRRCASLAKATTLCITLYSYHRGDNDTL